MFNKLNEWKENVEVYRDRIQSGEKKSGRWKKRWHKYSSKLYLFMFFLTVSGFVFFNYSRLFFKDDSPLLDSGIGEISKTKIGSSEAEIVSRKINNSTGYAEVLVHVEESSDQVHKEYVSFAGEVKKEQPIETKLIPISENYYLIQLHGVPKNWKTIGIDFGYNATQKAPTTVEQIEEQSQQKQTDRSQQTSFYWDVRKSKTDDDLKEKPRVKYLADVIVIEEKATRDKQKLLAKSTEKIDSEIVRIDEKVKQETEELIYKVGKEKEDSQTKIAQLEREKDKYIEAKSGIKKEEKLLDEKLEKLKERKEQSTIN